jgi:hypothetical protein
VRFLSWTYDPDPGDSETVTEYTFVLRGPDGSVSNVSETHHCGLFSRETWIRLLTEAGLTATAHSEIAAEGERARLWFVGVR